jgi:hypothetical protein
MKKGLGLDGAGVRAVRVAVVVVLAVLTFVMGSVAIGWSWMRVRNGILVPWRFLGSPPDGAARIVGIDLEGRGPSHSSAAVVYVEATAGRIYKAHGQDQRIVWVRSSRSEVTSWQWDCGLDPVVEPPRDTVNSAGISWCGEWHGGQVCYAIRDDGSVWRWGNDHSILSVCSMLCVGPVAGIALVIALGKFGARFV